EAPADRQSQTGPGPDPIALSGAIELVEDPLEILFRDAVAFVQHLKDDGPLLLPGLYDDGRLRRGIFGGVVEQVEEHLLEQHGIDRDHRQVAGEADAAPLIHTALPHTI